MTKNSSSNLLTCTVAAATIMAATLLLVGAAPATAAPGFPALPTQAGGDTVLYKIEHASLDSAYKLASAVCQAVWQQVGNGDLPDGTRCNVEGLERERMLAVTAGAQVQAEIVTLLEGLDRAPETRAFHIVVLAGSRSGQSSPDVPESARSALEDVGEFLPYTSFRVLGSGWLRTSHQGETILPGPMEFRAGLNFRASTEPGSPILIERFSIVQPVAATYTDTGELATERSIRRVLQTTFTISPGETVVVGTSKLNGDDDAVIVLLTAVQN